MYNNCETVQYSNNALYIKNVNKVFWVRGLLLSKQSVTSYPVPHGICIIRFCTDLHVSRDWLLNSPTGSTKSQWSTKSRFPM